MAAIDRWRRRDVEKELERVIGQWELNSPRPSTLPLEDQVVDYLIMFLSINVWVRNNITHRVISFLTQTFHVRAEILCRMT